VLYEKEDMKKYLNGKIVIRKTVADKLIKISKHLGDQYPHIGLRVVYAFRSLDIQQNDFHKRYEILKQEHPEMEDAELIELPHRNVAVPDVAGYPTGGAEDITLFHIETGEEIDMGSSIADYRMKKYYKISPNQLENCLLLDSFMTRERFAPFLGEGLHFSYEDSKWAHYYKQLHAIYEQKQANQILFSFREVY
jgi:D-alanyl-D-alanine dipeptidase